MKAAAVLIGGRGICPLFPSPRKEHLAAQVSSSRGNWPSMAKKEKKERNAYALGLAGAGRTAWAQLELPETLF